jgi:hypothetical protein
VISLTVPPTPADANPVVARLLAAAGNLRQPEDFMCRWRRGIKAPRLREYDKCNNNVLPRLTMFELRVCPR